MLVVCIVAAVAAADIHVAIVDIHVFAVVAAVVGAAFGIVLRLWALILLRSSFCLLC